MIKIKIRKERQNIKLINNNKRIVSAYVRIKERKEEKKTVRYSNNQHNEEKQ